jgi:hypothetical protein
MAATLRRAGTSLSVRAATRRSPNCAYSRSGRSRRSRRALACRVRATLACLPRLPPVRLPRLLVVSPRLEPRVQARASAEARQFVRLIDTASNPRVVVSFSACMSDRANLRRFLGVITSSTRTGIDGHAVQVQGCGSPGAAPGFHNMAPGAAASNAAVTRIATKACLRAVGPRRDRLVQHIRRCCQTSSECRQTRDSS